MKDKLKMIVEKVIEGGGIKHIGRKHLVNILIHKEDSIRITRYKKDPNEKIKVPVVHTSFRLLITSPAAMGALFKKGSFSQQACRFDCAPTDEECGGRITCVSIPAYVYHGLKAAELLLTQGQQQSIEYIWKECGE